MLPPITNITDCRRPAYYSSFVLLCNIINVSTDIYVCCEGAATCARTFSLDSLCMCIVKTTVVQTFRGDVHYIVFGLYFFR